jgi:anti-sigma-K factor RskA
VNSKSFWRLAVIFVLCLALAQEAKADSLKTTGELAVVAIVAVAAAVVVVTVVLITQTKGRTITGCVNSGESGMLVTDEKDKRVYVLSGNTAGVKPGERMSLTGRKIKANSGATLVWETKKISKDFGSCRP